MLAAIKCLVDGVLVVYRDSDSGEKKVFFLSQYWNIVTLVYFQDAKSRAWSAGLLYVQ